MSDEKLQSKLTETQKLLMKTQSDIDALKKICDARFVKNTKIISSIDKKHEKFKNNARVISIVVLILSLLGFVIF